MAITLTKDYQKIAETNMGSWGFGTLYLRLYGKYNSQDTTNNKTNFSLQERVYCDGVYCTSNNCYAWISGTNIQDNTNLTFPTNDELILGTKTRDAEHLDDGTCYIEEGGGFKCYALDLDNLFEVGDGFNLPKINRKFTTTPQITFQSKTETEMLYKWITSEPCSAIIWKGGGTATFTGLNSKSGTITVTGLTANKAYSHYGIFIRSDSGISTNSNTLTNSTYNYPYVSTVEISNLIIGDSQKLTLYNPLNRNVTVYMYQYGTGIQFFKEVTDKKSIEFLPNKTTLYNSIKNSTTGDCYYYCVYDGKIVVYKNGTYTINRSECLPEFKIFLTEDINSKTLSLTGNNQIMLKGYSDLKITISLENKAIAKNGSSILKYVAVSGDKTAEVNYSNTESVNMVINKINSADVQVYAVDSRGLSSKSVPQVLILKNYYKPIISEVKCYRENGIGTKAIVELSGKYWNGNFGNKDNSIFQISYQYKKVRENTYSNTISLTNQFTYSDGSYKNKDNAFIPAVSESTTALEFDVGEEYDLIFIVSDQAYSITYTFSTKLQIDSGIPCTAKQKNSDGKYSIGINCLPDEKYALKINGYGKIDFLKVKSKVYEESISDVKSSNQYPTLISKSITTYGGDLLIDTHCFSYASAAFFLKSYIVIDGVNKGFTTAWNSTLKACKSGSIIVSGVAEGTHTIELKIFNTNGANEIITKPAFTSCGFTVVEL